MAANGLDHYIGAFASDVAAAAWLTAAGYTTFDGLVYRNTALGILKQYDGQQVSWVAVGSGTDVLVRILMHFN